MWEFSEKFLHYFSIVSSLKIQKEPQPKLNGIVQLVSLCINKSDLREICPNKGNLIFIRLCNFGTHWSNSVQGELKKQIPLKVMFLKPILGLFFCPLFYDQIYLNSILIKVFKIQSRFSFSSCRLKLSKVNFGSLYCQYVHTTRMAICF